MSRRPVDTAFSQQKLTAFSPKLSINGFILEFFLIGLIFIPLGIMLLTESNDIKTYSNKYDASSGMDTDCSISEANAGGTCTITFDFTEDVSGPLYVYYELTNYYQNNRRYLKSTSPDQLLGANLDYAEVEADCHPLVENGTQLLNPCGLIANSFFNDVINLSSAPIGFEMLETEISWPSDLANKFIQVDGYVQAVVTDTSLTCLQVFGVGYSDCGSYTDTSTSTTYYYWYPDNDSVQYLYESYPDIVSPIEGIKNEHFVNWMRTAGLPKFRKLYGRITSDIKAGQSLTFNIATNFEVISFEGSKSLIISTLADYGGQNYALGNSVIIIGTFSLAIGILFAFKRVIDPRPLGDIRHLNWE